MEEALEQVVMGLIAPSGWKLALAESCTGGLVSHRITNVPGSSSFFSGGIVTYSNQAKMSLLGVQAETLEAYGAVSEQTVREMARGARRALSAEIGAAVSGIAGPGGATPGKPVGLVWIGLSAPDFEGAWRYVWQGDRASVKEQSAQAVLHHIVQYLRQASENEGG
jgi:nicotinamide-nucleotide amidase